MKANRLQMLAAAWSCIGMLFSPALTLGSQQLSSAADVQLREGGVLVGQVVDAQGAPVADSTVSVFRDGLEVATMRTDENGNYSTTGLRGGVHQIVSTGHQGM